MGKDGKHTPLKRIDERPPQAIGGIIPLADPSSGSRALTPPGTPSNLSLATGLAPEWPYKPYINAFWDEPGGYEPDFYEVAITASGGGTEYFRADHSHQAAMDSSQQSIYIPNLQYGTLYSVQVRAVSRSGARSALVPTPASSITTAIDAGPPSAVSSLAADFTGPNLILTWTNPADTDLRDCLIYIYESASKATTYANGIAVASHPGQPGKFEWTIEENKRAVGNTSGDASLYVEIKARDFAGNLSTAATVSATNAAPGNISGLTTDFAGRDCVISWSASTSRDLQGYQITIDSVVQPLQIGTSYSYSIDRNRSDHSGTADTSLSISVVAVDVYNQVSATPATATATNAVPSNVAGLSHSWNGDTGTAGPDLVISWTANTDRDLVGYRVTLDGVAQGDILGTTYSYTYQKNRQDHSGTADPIISISVVAVDAYNQVSATAATATATNAAPAAPSSVMIEGGLTILAINATIATLPKDLLTFRYRVIKNGSTFVTYDSAATLEGIRIDERATYQVGVKVVDVFNQESSETLSASQTIDALSISLLRSNAVYTDSTGTSSATLNSIMKDDTTSVGISYPANTQIWIQQERPFVDRYEGITISVNNGAQGFIGISEDGATWIYYMGPYESDGYTLSDATSDIAVALANRVTLPTFGRIDLREMKEARYIRLYCYNTVIFSVFEFYARRMIESDDIRSESIKTINLAAGAVTVDKLNVPGTASFDAQLRLIAFRVPVSLDSNSGIYQGSGTFASPTTGLKIWNDGGTGRLAGYNGGTLQAELATDGKIKGGGGTTILDSTGLSITTVAGSGSWYNNERAIRWEASGNVVAKIFSFGDSSRGGMILSADPDSGDPGSSLYAVQIDRYSTSSGAIRFTLNGVEYAAANTISGGTFTIRVPATIEATATVWGLLQAFSDCDVFGGLNIGTATGAATGAINASGSIRLDTGNAMSIKDTAGGTVNFPLFSSNEAYYGRVTGSTTGVNKHVFRTGNNVDRFIIDNGKVFVPGLRSNPATPETNEIYVDASGFLKRG